MKLKLLWSLVGIAISVLISSAVFSCKSARRPNEADSGLLGYGTKSNGTADYKRLEDQFNKATDFTFDFTLPGKVIGENSIWHCNGMEPTRGKPDGTFNTYDGVHRFTAKELGWNRDAIYKEGIKFSTDRIRFYGKLGLLRILDYKNLSSEVSIPGNLEEIPDLKDLGFVSHYRHTSEFGGPSIMIIQLSRRSSFPITDASLGQQPAAIMQFYSKSASDPLVISGYEKCTKGG
ncbi:MAG: hypothetical protein NTV34_04050 [Proteobacteria bacterium]|nr:hypothetical protein [Pseudomonadota bacterium]